MRTTTRTLAICRPSPTEDLIRIGRDNDGGYVIPQRVCDAAEVVVGLGISTDWSFEAGFLGRNPRAKVVAVDATVSADVFRARGRDAALSGLRLLMKGEFRHVRARVSESREYFRLARAFDGFFQAPNRFMQKFLTEADSIRSLSWQTLRDGIVERSGRRELGAVFVKMDIEGAEYRVLPEVLRDAHSILGMAIEFHDCDLMWERFEEMIAMLQVEYMIVHVHGNNCTPLIPGTTIPRTLEISVMHRRLLTPLDQIPGDCPLYPRVGLDQPNDPSMPDFPLDFGRVTADVAPVGAR